MKQLFASLSFAIIVFSFATGSCLKGQEQDQEEVPPKWISGISRFVSEAAKVIEEQIDEALTPAVEMPLVPVYKTRNWFTKNTEISYWIGEYDVTVVQYTAFLNAVAAEDTYHLYDEKMENVAAWYSNDVYSIMRVGSPGYYSYRAMSNHPLTPISFVDLYSALRFCNWLHNGQPSGKQAETTTERGAYTLDGATATVNKVFTLNEKKAKYFIPTFDQWNQTSHDIMKVAFDESLSNQMRRWSTLLEFSSSGNLSVRAVSPGLWYGVIQEARFAGSKSADLTFRVAVPNK